MIAAFMKAVVLSFSLAAIVAATPQLYAATLRHDLFSRPSLETLKPAQPEPVKALTPPAPPPKPPEWKPELTAIISGGGSALVNVEGRILRIGQELDGYRLVEVQERQAIFVKDKVRYTLVLNHTKAKRTPTDSVKPAAAPAAPAPVLAPALALPPQAASAPDRERDATRDGVGRAR